MQQFLKGRQKSSVLGKLWRITNDIKHIGWYLSLGLLKANLDNCIQNIKERFWGEPVHLQPKAKADIEYKYVTSREWVESPTRDEYKNTNEPLLIRKFLAIQLI